MGLPEDITKLLKTEGYRTNDSIDDALRDFIAIVIEEDEEMDDERTEDDGDDEVDGVDGLKAER